MPLIAGGDQAPGILMSVGGVLSRCESVVHIRPLGRALYVFLALDLENVRNTYVACAFKSIPTCMNFHRTFEYSPCATVSHTIPQIGKPSLAVDGSLEAVILNIELTAVAAGHNQDLGFSEIKEYESAPK